MPEIRRMGYILTGLLGLTVLTAFVWKPAPPAKFVGIVGAQLPTVIGTYSGVDIPVDSETRAAIPSADIIQRQYTGTVGSPINVTIIGGTGRNELHDPRSCLVGAGWQIQNDHTESLPTQSNVPVRSCEIAYNGPGGSSQGNEQSAEDMLYLYVVNRKEVASASAIRWTLLTSDLLGQDNQPVYFIRTFTDMPAFGSNSRANDSEHRRLVKFTAKLWDVLGPTIDQGERS